MFSSPEFVSASSYNHEKGERTYNSFLVITTDILKAFSTNLHTIVKSKKSSPSQTCHPLLHEAISPSPSPTLLLPTIPTERMKPNEKSILSCFGLLQLAKNFLYQPRLWLSSAALPRPAWTSKATHILTTSAARQTEIKSTVGQFLLLWNASNSYRCWQKWCEINFQAYTALEVVPLPPKLILYDASTCKTQMRNGLRQLHLCAVG